jgi:hypothetical protein
MFNNSKVRISEDSHELYGITKFKVRFIAGFLCDSEKPSRLIVRRGFLLSYSQLKKGRADMFSECLEEIVLFPAFISAAFSFGLGIRSVFFFVPEQFGRKKLA